MKSKRLARERFLMGKGRKRAGLVGEQLRSGGGSRLRGGGLAVLCVALFASVVSLAGGLGASPVLAQDASAGPLARVWAKKLASGNVEFGAAVYATPNAAASPATVNYRYFRYADSTVGTWYNSDPFFLGSGTDSTLVAVRARKLASGNLEFALRVFGMEDSLWSPAARYFAYAGASVNSFVYSSAFFLRQYARACARGAVTIAQVRTNVGLFRDCEALLASKEALEGPTPPGVAANIPTAIHTWSGSTRLWSWWGGTTLAVTMTGGRVTSLNVSIPGSALLPSSN